MPKLKTAGEASLLLAKYEHANMDLPRDLRRQMGAFAIAPRVRKSALEDLFEGGVGSTPYAHRSWFWYTSLRTSGIEHLWDSFAAARNSGASLYECTRALRAQADDDSLSTLARRLDNKRLSTSTAPSDKGVIWTRGGTWHTEDNFTKIILLGEHLERDTYDYNKFSRALGPDGARRIERELHNLIDPDALLHPDAKYAALHYVQERIPDILGWNWRASDLTASWFFQTLVPDADGVNFMDWRDGREFRPRASRSPWRWFGGDS